MYKRYTVFFIWFTFFIAMVYGEDAIVTEALFSSYLIEPYDINAYHPVLAFDNNEKTAWLEHGQGPGLGEFVGIVLAKPVTVDKISIIPGFYDDKYFKENYRIKKARLVLDKESIILTFEDKMEKQEKALPKAISFKTAKIYLEEVYPTTKWEDTALAELVFYYKGKRINLDVRRYKNNLQTATALKTGIMEQYPHDYKGQLLMSFSVLLGLNNEGLDILSNSVYAKYGYPYFSSRWFDYFQVTNWYKVNPYYTDEQINENDRENLNRIKAMQNNFPETEEFLKIAKSKPFGDELNKLLYDAGEDAFRLIGAPDSEFAKLTTFLIQDKDNPGKEGKILYYCYNNKASSQQNYLFFVYRKTLFLFTYRVVFAGLRSGLILFYCACRCDINYKQNRFENFQLVANTDDFEKWIGTMQGNKTLQEMLQWQGSDY